MSDTNKQEDSIVGKLFEISDIKNGTSNKESRMKELRDKGFTPEQIDNDIINTLIKMLDSKIAEERKKWNPKITRNSILEP